METGTVNFDKVLDLNIWVYTQKCLSYVVQRTSAWCYEYGFELCAPNVLFYCTVTDNFKNIQIRNCKDFQSLKLCHQTK